MLTVAFFLNLKVMLIVRCIMTFNLEKIVWMVVWGVILFCAVLSLAVLCCVVLYVVLSCLVLCSLVWLK